MSLKPETITQLQTLIQADPALIAQLQSCTDAASSAAVIAKAAAAKGMEVSAPDMVAHFEAATAKQGAMSDAELEQVAGGLDATSSAVLVSIFSFGLACASVSLTSAILRRDCNAAVTEMGRAQKL